MGKRIVVDLTLGCTSCPEGSLAHGAGEEYPHGWAGMDTGERSDMRKLAKVRFPHHFTVKGEKKTDKNKCLFVPVWLLRPATE